MEIATLPSLMGDFLSSDETEREAWTREWADIQPRLIEPMGRQEALLGCLQHTRKPCLVSCMSGWDSGFWGEHTENSYWGLYHTWSTSPFLQVLGVMGTDCSEPGARGLGSQANITTRCSCSSKVWGGCGRGLGFLTPNVGLLRATSLAEQAWRD